MWVEGWLDGPYYVPINEAHHLVQNLTISLMKSPCSNKASKKKKTNVHALLKEGRFQLESGVLFKFQVPQGSTVLSSTSLIQVSSAAGFSSA